MGGKSLAPNGRVDVAWYDWRNDASWVPDVRKNVFQDVYYTSSVDGGLTWGPTLRPNDRALARHIGVSNQGGIRGPIGIGSRDEAAYVARAVQLARDPAELASIRLMQAQMIERKGFFDPARSARAIENAVTDLA